jgi:phage/plasmid-like protein (TIGR03299 family)
MPANIAEGRNGVHRAAYVKRPAWHGLGVILPKHVTWPHIYKAAQLDYHIDTVPVYVKKGRGFVEVPEFAAQRRRDTGDVFAVTSRVYKAIQNVEIGRVLDALVAEKAAAYVSAFALGKGERVAAVLELAALKNLHIKGDTSKMDAFLTATTRHDGLGAMNVVPSMMRLDCQNMLNMATDRAERSGKLVSIRHAGDTTHAIEEARRILGFVEKESKDYIVTMEALAETPIAKSFLDDYLEQLIPIAPDAERPAAREAARDTIRALYSGSKTLVGVKPSAYRLLQATTEYADHYRPTRVLKGRNPAEVHFRSVTEGPAYDIKAAAIDILRQYAEVPVPVLAKRSN